MSVKSQIEALRRTLPSKVKVVAVSKFHPAATIREAYDAGQRIFGESRVQELLEKSERLPADIEWHFIGSLQRNKVKQIAPFISLIHSMDSPQLMLEIEKQGAKNNRVISCLLQVHIADEETKSGFSPDDCRRFLAEGAWRNCSHVQFRGVMGMATFTDNEAKIRSEFRLLKSLFEEFRTAYFASDPLFSEVSMGMSGDYLFAVEEGSTLIRVGTLIFGDR